MAQVSIADYKPPRRGFRGIFKDMHREWTAYLWHAPGLLIFAVFVAYALYSSFALSFHEWNILEADKRFVGLQNYREVLTDDTFWRSLGHTAYYMIGSVPTQMAIGLGLALLLNKKIRGLALFRTAYYLPVITPIVIAAIIWKWVYEVDFGLANYYLQRIGLIDEPLRWLSDPALAMPAVIVMIVWKAVGFNMIIYLAGLQAIPNEYYEAADVDGAGPWQRFRKITLPLVAPTTLFLLVLNMIGSMKSFEQLFVMTQGGPPGPGGATTTVVYWIYQQAFVYFRMGYASALAYVLFILMFALALVQFRWFTKRAGGA